MASNKKHGCLWWALIGWWYAPLDKLTDAKPKQQPQVHPAWQAQQERLRRAAEQAGQAPTPAPATTPTPVPSPAPVAAQAPSAPKSQTHKVAGITHHMDAVKALGSDNPEYSMTKKELEEEGRVYERVYKTDYYISKTELVPEPDNPHDANAIKVVCDGHHIGYIKAGSCARVHKLLREGLIRRIDCELTGGPYKILVRDYDAEAGEEDEYGYIDEDSLDDEEKFTMEKDSHEHCAKLTIWTD